MGQRAARSLKASPIGISYANQSLLNFESKIALADELEISRATVHKFFIGKPIGRENFHKICQKLQLSWQAIADLPNENELVVEELTIDSLKEIDLLVQEVRQKGRTYIESKCGIVRVLYMSQPIELNDIFTEVNIFEKLSGQQRLEMAEVLKVCVNSYSERPELNQNIQKRVLGLEAIEKYPKLKILGKPGAGKTTFLKYLVIQCIQGHLLANLVPVFINLKVFAELEHQPSLLEWITAIFHNYGVTNENYTKKLLAQGRILLLLDGLDEVKGIHTQRVLNAISSFYHQFERNRFIITCRTAAQEFSIEEFVEVELADFDDTSIANFVRKWFAKKEPDKAPRFLQELQLNPAIRELANNPLLLTLLCLVFEESTDLPAHRLELYQEGVNILLGKWDAKRNIEREQIYQQLSIQHKQELLSHIAFISFERGDYFLKQQELEQYITNYIEQLLRIDRENTEFLCDSTAILKSIEAQHGLLVERARSIYSFSHLTFQEYFTARKIANNARPQNLEHLSDCIADKRWREVILLTVGMLESADFLLLTIQQKIDSLLASEPSLQAFLNWVARKSASMRVSDKPATVRAFYYDLALARSISLFGSTFELSRMLNPNFNRSLEPDLALDLALDRALILPQSIHRVADPDCMIERVIERAIVRSRTCEPELVAGLQKLKQQLPRLSKNQQQFQQWWQANGTVWTEQLRQTIQLKRNLGHCWQFSQQQKKILKQYYDASLLLVECLNMSFFVSREVREKIEFMLLLPMTETRT